MIVLIIGVVLFAILLSLAIFYFVDKQDNTKAGVFVAIALLAASGGFVGEDILSPLPQYEIVDNTVFINTSAAYMSATPHTLTRDGWVEFEVLTKSYSGNINLFLGFNTDGVVPTKLQRKTFENITIDTTDNETNETTQESYLVESWEDVLANPQSINFEYADKNKIYLFQNVPFTAGQKRTFRIYFDTQEGVDIKYDWGGYLSTYGVTKAGIQQAIDNNHFYLLDPWVETPEFYNLGQYFNDEFDDGSVADWTNQIGIDNTNFLSGNGSIKETGTNEAGSIKGTASPSVSVVSGFQKTTFSVYPTGTFGATSNFCYFYVKEPVVNNQIYAMTRNYPTSGYWGYLPLVSGGAWTNTGIAVSGGWDNITAYYDDDFGGSQQSWAYINGVLAFNYTLNAFDVQNASFFGAYHGGSGACSIDNVCLGTSEEDCPVANFTNPYHFNLTINSSKVSSDLTDFPVYVNLADAPASFWGNTTDCGELRVTNSEGTELPRELVSCNVTANTGELHFKADFINSSADTTFSFFYGNDSLNDYADDATYGAENVWDSWDSVFHFESSTEDATGDYDPPASNGLAYNAELLGTALRTNVSTASRITVNTDTPRYSNNLTITGWLNVQDADLGPDYYIAQDGGGDINWYVVIEDSDRSQFLFHRGDGGSNIDLHTYTGAPTGQWYQWTVVHDCSQSKSILYINGSIVYNETTDYCGGPSTNTRYLFATSGGGDGYIPALHDEIRYDGTVKSTDEISASFENQASPSTFYSITEGGGEAPVDLPNATLCSGILSFEFYANISRGTYYPTTQQYYEQNITPRNNSVCGYTYLLNNSVGFSLDYTFTTNYTNPNTTLRVAGTEFNTTITVGAGEVEYVNITYSYDNISLLWTELPFSIDVATSVPT